MILLRRATPFAIFIAIVFAILAPASPALSGQIHRCVDASGAVIFSDQQCARGTTGGAIIVKPNEIDTSANREAVLRSENAKLQEQLDRAEAAASVSKSESNASQNPQTSPSAPAFDNSQCVAARGSYEFAASSITMSEREIDARRSAMYVACNMPEPKRTTIINITPERSGLSQGIRRQCVDSRDTNCVRMGTTR